MKALLLLPIFGAVAAHAECTQYSYTGQPFNLVTASSNNDLPASSPIVGSLTLSQALPPNATLLTVTPATWQFSLVNDELTYTNGWFEDYPTPSFQFSTDANGNITDWLVTVDWSNSPGTLNVYDISMTVAKAGDQIAETYDDLNNPVGPMSITGSSATSGTWTCVTQMTAAYTAPPPPPPPVNPLAAQVAALTAEVNSLTAQRNNAEAINTIYLAEIRTFAAELAASRTEVAALTAEVEKLKSTK